MNRKTLLSGVVVMAVISGGMWWVYIWQMKEPAGTAVPADHGLTNVVIDAQFTGDDLSLAEKQQRVLAAFRTPIAFYGKVIDQHGNPVPRANVKLSANDKPLDGGPCSEYYLTADANGHFEKIGIVGMALGVAVSKPGYLGIPQTDSRKITSSASFQYALKDISGPHRPTKDAPAVFTLYKQGPKEPLVKVGEKNFRIPRDGSPLVISLNDAKDSVHRVVLRCWNGELARPEGQRQYDWRLEITVPGGVLVPRRDAFSFEAPVDGYVTSQVIDMSASLPPDQWDSFAERSYFIQYDDGTFARANLEMHAGGDHFVSLESFFNPKPGSRNLE